jgi:two-component system chemotaxis response regulator CheY
VGNDAGMTRNGRPTVLIVDDEVDMRLLVRVILESGKGDVEVVGEAVDGIDALEKFNTLDPPAVPDVVILDNRMPGRSGIEVAEEMLRNEPRQSIVLFSGFFTPEVEARAKELGVAACVSKTDFERLPQLVLDLAQSAG